MGIFFKHIRIFFLISLCFFQISLRAKDLTLADVKSTMQQMFTYHVENKSFSPLIAKRSFKLFIEQFDPEKLYLLRSEVDLFLELSEKDVKWVVHQYNRNEYEEYVKLNQLIQKSITRHRRIREELRVEILSETSFKDSSIDSYGDYAKSEGELKRRMRKKLHKIMYVRESRSESLLDSYRKGKILGLVEKKLKRHESSYYTSDEKQEAYSDSKMEHFLSLHILKSLAKSLDAHSAYYNEDEALELRATLKKQFHGIGVVLKEGEEGIYIADLIAGGPADLSKEISVGAFLLEVNGVNLSEASFEEVLDHLKGDVGTKIELKLKSPKGKVQNVTLKREKIVLNQERLSYAYEPYADGVIGKIILPSFYDNGEGINAEKDLREAIKELKAKGPIYGLIIDMRENSGGFLSQAVKVAGLFITKGVVVISKYSDGEIRYIRDLDARMYYQGPLVLLTSKASASAAEIVAQSLQDYGVALIVGDERTYGKGSMQYQTITEESSKSFFKVTVGRYYTISGRSTQIDGVQADIVVPTIFSPFNIGERFLEYPLSSDSLDLKKSFEASAKEDYKNFPKKYLPYLYRKDSTWTSMIPTLKTNSEKRLAKDENFQCFLRKIRGEPCERKSRKFSRKKKLENDHGVEDLQMKECVFIVKDMIYLKSLDSK